MDALNRSLPVDIRFFPHDVKTNRIWADELTRIGVFTPAEHQAIDDALNRISARWAAGEFDTIPDDEDIHTLTERLLTELLGDTGARIHTGRSRNDQVACDLLLYLKDALAELKSHTIALILTIADIAERHAETLVAGMTHVQPAQPITLGHFLMSLCSALLRDVSRMDDTRNRMDRCPLGAGAIAGCGFPVDRERIARELGFREPADNSIDATSDRDAAQESAFVCAALLTHLSRYAEQFVLWSNPAFGYVKWADTWSTGSSMMPQKRNPDAMELVRAKAARVIGDTTALLAVTKGVPLAYAKDLQEDKEAVFDALDTALVAVRVFNEALKTACFLPDRMLAGLTSDMLATDLADALVTTGVPFRKAHERTARFLNSLEVTGRDLLAATPAELQNAFPEFDTPPRLGYRESLDRRQVVGGTAPASVRRQIEAVKKQLGTLK